MYNGINYWGMDIIWWVVWIGLLFWIFALPYNIPGQRNSKELPFDILRKRFASGEITDEEYHEKKKILEEEFLR
jgi:putative membrane protein